MQPEQAYYAHHPGRFVYLRDDDTGELFLDTLRAGARQGRWLSLHRRPA